MLKDSFPKREINIPDLYVTFRCYDRDATSDILVPGDTGKRLIPYDIRDSATVKFSDLHRGGYVYGFSTMPYQSFSGFWGNDPRCIDNPMFRVRLKNTDSIFIVDEAPFLEKREIELEKRTGQARKATDADAAEIFFSIAQTITPLAEYDGNFVRPIYLIGRPLKADEAQIFDLPFRVRLRNEEIARQARLAPLQAALFDDLFTEAKPDPGPPHLRLV